MGDIDRGFGGSCGFLPVLREPPAASKPGEGALDDPSAGKNFDASASVGALDDFDRPVPGLAQRAAQFGAYVEPRYGHSSENVSDYKTWGQERHTPEADRLSNASAVHDILRAEKALEGLRSAA